jgi:hypothetical protein
MIPRRWCMGALMALVASIALLDPDIAAGQSPGGTLRVRVIAEDGVVDAAAVRTDERRFGRGILFVNAENLPDARQTAYDPLLVPARSPEGRWTTEAWAPLEARVFNAWVRYEF